MCGLNHLILFKPKIDVNFSSLLFKLWKIVNFDAWRWPFDLKTIPLLTWNVQESFWTVPNVLISLRWETFSRCSNSNKRAKYSLKIFWNKVKIYISLEIFLNVMPFVYTREPLKTEVGRHWCQSVTLIKLSLLSCCKQTNREVIEWMPRHAEADSWN